MFEYKVIPAPAQGKRGKGAKGLAGRFANALGSAINEQAAEGWEYVRAESLPSADRTGITRKKVESFQNVLVFRRAIEPAVVAPLPVEETQLDETPIEEEAPQEVIEEVVETAEVVGVEDPEIAEVFEDAVEGEAEADVEDELKPSKKSRVMPS